MYSFVVEMKNKKILLVGGAVLASEVLWYIYKRVHNVWSNYINTRKVLEVQIPKSKHDISEVMFFTNESILCRTHFTTEMTCPKNNCPVRYLRHIESYMNNAKQSLDVCMYMFTCHSLSNAIVNAHKRGVLVRIIMDRQMGSNDAAQTALFYNNGIAIRLICQDGLMHHKFMIVDNDLVITGSTNWTMSAFFGNFDHIVVTNQHSLVKPFVVEFDRLWKTFSKSQEN
ncbi:mitochondrial cardiolipin hydrolase isoform X2 [Bombus vancouverensis nearcticus]|nr:mitochondrial cardiolipin hydrolase isoform X1 [Bombus vancouverensis nearcticus]XP_033187311.1 mitochondrial cardiolipin hydrolase isoform X1 [Bombus vancouverensis nearcticus]XP_033302809.1 mitochondrial cardiolipin hydrolase isoform X1 [Bombus bifarius]XP_033302818.1 mitochondrial cardiolipin hydrolase isoform X1 [Bombus bifarius]